MIFRLSNGMRWAGARVEARKGKFPKAESDEHNMITRLILPLWCPESIMLRCSPRPSIYVICVWDFSRLSLSAARISGQREGEIKGRVVGQTVNKCLFTSDEPRIRFDPSSSRFRILRQFFVLMNNR
jgi:hypothetical protein